MNKRIAGFIISAVFAAALPLSAYAEISPAFTRTDEEWTLLRDNKLEWSEIPDLIKEYNADVIDNENSFKKDETTAMNASEVKSYLIRQANNYEDTATDLEDVTGMASTAASMRALANSTRLSAEENVTDSSVIRMGYDQKRDAITLEAQNYFINYYNLKLQREYLEKNYAYLERSYASAVAKQSVGMATETDVLNAKKTLDTAEAGLTTAKASESAAYKNLIVLCGWKYDSNAEIGELPAFDFSTIDAIDYEADKAKALENSYTLRSDRIKLSNVDSADDVEYVTSKYQRQLASDTSNVENTIKQDYDALITARNSWVTANTAFVLANDNLLTGARQLQLGTISAMDYAGIEESYRAAEKSLKAAEYSVYSAMITYQSAVNGLT